MNGQSRRLYPVSDYLDSFKVFFIFEGSDFLPGHFLADRRIFQEIYLIFGIHTLNEHVEVNNFKVKSHNKTATKLQVQTIRTTD